MPGLAEDAPFDGGVVDRLESVHRRARARSKADGPLQSDFLSYLNIYTENRRMQADNRKKYDTV